MDVILVIALVGKFHQVASFEDVAYVAVVGILRRNMEHFLHVMPAEFVDVFDAG